MTLADVAPFLRWAGSKRKQLTRLSSFWSETHTRYIEPFCGSACLFFKIEPHAGILGDNNRELIELYRVVRDEPVRLYKRLKRIKRDLPTYNRWRSINPKELDTETRALRFLYLNRNCFNGIYRTNLSGNFNVPMGKQLGNYFTLENLMECSELLQRTKFISGDFSKTLTDIKKGDFVYLDPPYAVTSRKMFREYSKKSFGSIDIPRFSDSLDQIHKSKADFLVSYADCKEARLIATSWNAIRLPVRRSVAGFSDARKMAYEWLITNCDMPANIRN